MCPLFKCMKFSRKFSFDSIYFKNGFHFWNQDRNTSRFKFKYYYNKTHVAQYDRPVGIPPFNAITLHDTCFSETGVLHLTFVCFCIWDQLSHSNSSIYIIVSCSYRFRMLIAGIKFRWLFHFCFFFNCGHKSRTEINLVNRNCV